MTSNPRVVAFARLTAAESAVVVLNPTPDSIAANMAADDSLLGNRRVILGTHRRAGEDMALRDLRLNAFEALIAI